MHVNNFDKIKSLLVFKDSDTFYHLQILKRKKEHPVLKRNSICLRTLCISSIEDLERNEDDIIKMCDALNLRAYINLNARSYRMASLETNEKLAKQIKQDDFISARKAYTSVLGAMGVKKGYEKRWVLDCDDMSYAHVEVLSTYLKPLQPEGDKVVDILKTKNGYHIISKPFNLLTLPKICDYIGIPLIEVHKNNPTILYV